MLKKYNNLSLCFGIPGLVLQIAGFVLNTPEGHLVLKVAGTALLLIGLTYYARAKGQHPAWCLAAFLSIVGLIILACLRDKSLSQADEKQLVGPGKPKTVLVSVVSKLVMFLVVVAVLVIIFKLALH